MTEGANGPCTAITANSVCRFVTVIPAGTWAFKVATTSVVFDALGTKKKSSSLFRYAIRSSITPPFSLHSRVYWAKPFPIRARSLVNIELRNSRAPFPTTLALPKCETSKIPTFSRTAPCSASTPAPGYSIGISQPPKSAILALRARCLSCKGECFIV